MTVLQGQNTYVTDSRRRCFSWAGMEREPAAPPTSRGLPDPPAISSGRGRHPMSSYPESSAPTCPICQTNKLRDRQSKKCRQCALTPGWYAPDTDRPLPRGYEDAWREWLRWIVAARERYSGPSKRPVTSGRLRAAVCGDPHCPFEDKRVVAEMFEDTKDCDTLIVAGDVGDSYALSRFLKYETVPIETECAAVTAFLEQCSERYPRVILLEGNHGCARLEKQLLDKLPRDVVAAVRILTGGSLSLLQAVARRYPNVEIAKTKVGRFDLDWLVQIGDAVICHAEKFSIVPGAAMRKVEEWLADQERTLNLQPWRVVFQAHTHQLSSFPWHADKLLAETGCLCAVHGYQLTAKIGGRPQRQGWWKFEQRDGKTDLDSLQMRWRNEQPMAA